MSPLEIERNQLQNELEVLRRTSDQRLDRIEKKIDQLSDAMVTLARAEEKLIGIEKNNINLVDRINRHSEKIDNLESQLDEARNTISIMTKGMYLILSSFIVTIASKVIGVF